MYIMLHLKEVLLLHTLRQPLHVVDKTIRIMQVNMDVIILYKVVGSIRVWALFC